MCEVFSAALRLGLTSFGGPIAHLGYFRREYVERRHWLDEASYADLVALCQSLPGPASSQLGIAIGTRRAGPLGGVVAWIGFTLPSAIILVLFAQLTGSLDPSAVGWVHGLKIAAVAVVFQAVRAMGRTLTGDWPRRTIAALAALVALAWTSPFADVAIIVSGALVGWFLLAPPAAREDTSDPSPVSRRVGIAALVVFVILLVGLVPDHLRRGRSGRARQARWTSPGAGSALSTRSLARTAGPMSTPGSRPPSTGCWPLLRSPAWRSGSTRVTLQRRGLGRQSGVSRDLAALARLVAVERRLESLHSALDITGGSTPIGLIALAFGHRARSLYLGVVHAVNGPSEATAQAALRGLVEQTILLPWLLLNPDVHPFLWKAEHERHLRNLIRDAPTKAGSKFAADLAAGVSADTLERLDRSVAEARALAAEKGVVGVRKVGSLLPPLDVMTAQVGTPEAKEAYHIAYNMISGWTHSSAGGLGMFITPAGVVFDDGPVEDTAPIRSVAAAAYLYMLEIVSREARQLLAPW